MTPNKLCIARLVLWSFSILVLIFTVVFLCANFCSDKTIEVFVGAILLSIVIGPIGTFTSEKINIFRNSQKKARPINYDIVVLMFAFTILIGDLAVFVAAPKKTYSNSLEVEYYFNLDKKRFLPYRTTPFRSDPSDNSFEERNIMSSLLRKKPDIVSSLDKFKNPNEFVGQPIANYEENQRVIYDLFRDYGEALLLLSLDSQQDTRDWNLMVREWTNKAMPPKNVMNPTPLHFADFFTDIVQNTFVGTAETSIYIPKGFHPSTASRSVRRSVFEINKSWGPIKPFSLKLAVRGPEFDGPGTGIVPRFINKNMNGLWLGIRYRFELEAEPSNFLFGSKRIDEYIDWSKNLWSAINHQFERIQLRDQNRYMIERFEERLDRIDTLLSNIESEIGGPKR